MENKNLMSLFQTHYVQYKPGEKSFNEAWVDSEVKLFSSTKIFEELKSVNWISPTKYVVIEGAFVQNPEYTAWARSNNARVFDALQVEATTIQKVSQQKASELELPLDGSEKKEWEQEAKECKKSLEKLLSALKTALVNIEYLQGGVEAKQLGVPHQKKTLEETICLLQKQAHRLEIDLKLFDKPLLFRKFPKFIWTMEGLIFELCRDPLNRKALSPLGKSLLEAIEALKKGEEKPLEKFPLLAKEVKEEAGMKRLIAASLADHVEGLIKEAEALLDQAETHLDQLAEKGRVLNRDLTSSSRETEVQDCFKKLKEGIKSSLRDEKHKLSLRNSLVERLFDLTVEGKRETLKELELFVIDGSSEASEKEALLSGEGEKADKLSLKGTGFSKLLLFADRAVFTTGGLIEVEGEWEFEAIEGENESFILEVPKFNPEQKIREQKEIKTEIFGALKGRLSGFDMEGFQKRAERSQKQLALQDQISSWLKTHEELFPEERKQLEERRTSLEASVKELKQGLSALDQEFISFKTALGFDFEAYRQNKKELVAKKRLPKTPEEKTAYTQEVNQFREQIKRYNELLKEGLREKEEGFAEKKQKLQEEILRIESRLSSLEEEWDNKKTVEIFSLLKENEELLENPEQSELLNQKILEALGL